MQIAVCRMGYVSGWSGDNITDAIAEYEKTLVTPNSFFDNWLMGDDKAITAKEEDLHRFKVPNLRNVELTGPYMHALIMPAEPEYSPVFFA